MQDCWDTPVASGDLSDLSNMTAGVFNYLDGDFFGDGPSLGMPDSLEMPFSSAEMKLPLQWDDTSLPVDSYTT